MGSVLSAAGLILFMVLAGGYQVFREATRRSSTDAAAIESIGRLLVEGSKLRHYLIDTGDGPDEIQEALGSWHDSATSCLKKHCPAYLTDFTNVQLNSAYKDRGTSVVVRSFYEDWLYSHEEALREIRDKIRG